MVRIGIVAGEASGDLLGAGLILAIRQQIPDVEFTGIAGPEMIKAGCKALYPSEKLSVMGLSEVLGHLGEILKIRKHLRHYFSSNPPDIFIGIDAPDFNLGLERKLKEAGIKTVHYVSPSVWAWRQKRVKKISRSVDLMLTLFPFEEAFYLEHEVNVRFVGHPLADMIPMEPDQQAARKKLGLPVNEKVVALLPGSRMGEVQRLAGPMLGAAKILKQDNPQLLFVVPVASNNIREYFYQLQQEIAPEIPVTIIDGCSREVMAASEIVLLASGTAAMEAMLLKRPMVVAYKVSSLTYWILKTFNMLKVSEYSLPNLLAGKPLVKECMQHEATPEKLASATQELLDKEDNNESLINVFANIHIKLAKNASEQAADAVISMLPGSNA
ncbi:MAG: lipid-A-disaccharide synthase [Gammaproteobacteria bacterium]|nr:lipid-A-disaccharide synthase [Gammaproteobacteria bacterium]MCK5092450.1 lipid-A-disaccharide synthase [Gammaproteobacteria bacterium]